MASTTTSIDIPVSADRVWQLIGGFGSLPDWLPYIPTSELSEGGRVRSLTNEQGEVIVERLEAFDNDARTYTYSILQAPFPVTGYRATITVHGKPAPQGSKRHVGRGVMVESSTKVKPWREAVKHAALAAVHPTGFRRLDGPVRLDIVFVFDKPKAAPKRRRTWPITRASGDIDKLQRSTFDALTDAGLFRDDAQVVDVHARKVYTDDPDAPLQVPGAVIRVSEVPHA